MRGELRGKIGFNPILITFVRGGKIEKYVSGFSQKQKKTLFINAAPVSSHQNKPGHLPLQLTLKNSGIICCNHSNKQFLLFFFTLPSPQMTHIWFGREGIQRHQLAHNVTFINFIYDNA